VGVKYFSLDGKLEMDRSRRSLRGNKIITTYIFQKIPLSLRPKYKNHTWKHRKCYGRSLARNLQYASCIKTDGSREVVGGGYRVIQSRPPKSNLLLKNCEYGGETVKNLITKEGY